MSSAPPPPPPPGPDVPPAPLTPPGPPPPPAPPAAPLTPPGPPAPLTGPSGSYGGSPATSYSSVPPGGYPPVPPSGYGAPAPGAPPAWGAPPPAKKRSRAVQFSLLGVVVLALLGVGAYLAFFAGDGVAPLEADVAESVEAHAQQVVVGNCLAELPDDGDVDTVTVVPCDTDHEAQVISAKKFSKGAQFPGAKDAQAQTTEACTLDAIDEEIDPTTVELSVWAPTESSWEEGDRQGLCIATAPEGVTGSMIG